MNDQPHPPGVDPLLIKDLERRGVDWRQLVGRLRLSPDERLRCLEGFVEDIRQLREDLVRSRSRSHSS